MAERGYLEGKKMANAFNMLRSNDLIWPYVISNYLKGKQPYPFDLLYWNSDSTRMPAANHSFYLRNCYLENKLSKGQMVIDNVTARSRRRHGPDLQSGDARGPYRAGEVGVPRLEILRRPGEVRARGLRPYRGRGQSAGQAEIPVLDRRRAGRKSRPLAREGDRASGLVVAGLARVDQAAGRRDRAAREPGGGKYHADRGRAGELREGEGLDLYSVHIAGNGDHVRKAQNGRT